MKRYILKRLLFAIPTILGSMIVVFLIIRSIPGDPVAMKFGKSATVQEIEEYREEHGYNRPMAVQLVDSVFDTLRGDLGYSMANNQPVFGMILDCLPNTLELTIFGVLLAIVLGVTSGIFAALYRGSIFDMAILSLNTLLMSMPSFFLGLILIIVFGVQLKLIPVIGLNLAPEEHFLGLIGPVITVGLGSAASIARTTRTSMLKILGNDFIKVCKSKGIAKSAIILKHALRNALTPIITVVGGTFAAYLGGAVVTETVFARPGIGKLLVDAINARDYTVIQGTAVFLAVFMILVILVTDILYGVFDPRIRVQDSAK
ncbi:ABC transporter permease [[Clostridium] symbiosum]|uniref:ABC transporter permease n=1 Tax=Clostridium symbiosum TaxID=1512 RepID=UPI001D073781|nr:ABC transporter permease [[Clostridium] symbiosum]MCB6608295.1 ABC transporter permease [[Clostridium] symbiosum]MCB6932845.1 ABC transporter permease [[Clostridium] symbiosum]